MLLIASHSYNALNVLPRVPCLDSYIAHTTLADVVMTRVKELVALLNQEVKPLDKEDREDHVRQLIDKYPATVQAHLDYFSGEYIKEQEAPPLTIEEAAAGVATEGDKRLPKKTAKVDSVVTDSDAQGHPVQQAIQKLFYKGQGKKTQSQKPTTRAGPGRPKVIFISS